MQQVLLSRGSQSIQRRILLGLRRVPLLSVSQDGSPRDPCFPERRVPSTSGHWDFGQPLRNVFVHFTAVSPLVPLPRPPGHHPLHYSPPNVALLLDLVFPALELAQRHVLVSAPQWFEDGLPKHHIDWSAHGGFSYPTSSLPLGRSQHLHRRVGHQGGPGRTGILRNAALCGRVNLTEAAPAPSPINSASGVEQVHPGVHAVCGVLYVLAEG